MSDFRPVEPWKLALIGLTAGLLSGGFGVGGGIVIVPLLVAAAMDRHRAHATSLASIVPIAVAGALSFAISDAVELATGILVGLGGVVGSVIGTSVMHRMSSRRLAIFFGFVMLAAAVRMLSGADPLPGASGYGGLVASLIALGIGLVSGFFAGVAGVGGGVVIVPAVVLLLGFGQHAAQGTSLLAIILTALAGTAVNRRNRRLHLPDAVIVGLGGVIGSILGSRIALAVEGRTLSVVFGGLVLFVALRTLYQSFRVSTRAVEPRT